VGLGGRALPMGEGGDPSPGRRRRGAARRGRSQRQVRRRDERGLPQNRDEVGGEDRHGRRDDAMVAGKGKRATPALLAVDVGNTNTVLGLYEDGTLTRHWRLTSRREATSDEIALSVSGLVGSRTGRPPLEVIVASVGPSLGFPIRQAVRQLYATEPMFVAAGVETGLASLDDLPQEGAAGGGGDRDGNRGGGPGPPGRPWLGGRLGNGDALRRGAGQGGVRGRRHRPGHRDLRRGALRRGRPPLSRRDSTPGAGRGED